MAPKRSHSDDDAADSRPKKQRSGFNIGPDNLPDGSYRRKVIKIKHDMIQKAKLKKSYAKLKAREPVEPTPIPTLHDDDEEAAAAIARTAPKAAAATQELHPDRQAMLDAPEASLPSAINRSQHYNSNSNTQSQNQQRRPNNSNNNNSKKPAYFSKELAFAEQKKEEALARQAEFERRDKERKEKIEERERFRKAMAKARTGGKNGQRKLGKESQVLLERVKRMVGS